MVEVFWPGETSPGGGTISEALPGGIPGEMRSGYVQAMQESINPCAGMTMGSPAWFSCVESTAEPQVPAVPAPPPATPVKSGPEELAIMEATAAEAHKEYYGVGGEGYGTTPGGPDVYYFDYGQAQPTVYPQGSFLGWEAPSLPGKDDLLLYGALAIGALALLKR